jgi:hypothetical protein
MAAVEPVAPPTANTPDAIATVAVDALHRLHACVARHSALVDYVRTLVEGGVVKPPEKTESN